MDLRLYEITFVLEPQLDQAVIDDFVGKIEEIITGGGGRIEQKDYWGKRRLAYEIKRKQYGFYVYLLFRASGDTVAKIERELKLNESVLRFLTVRLSKNAIKQMIKDKILVPDGAQEEKIEEPVAEEPSVVEKEKSEETAE